MTPRVLWGVKVGGLCRSVDIRGKEVAEIVHGLRGVDLSRVKEDSMSIA